MDTSRSFQPPVHGRRQRAGVATILAVAKGSAARIGTTDMQVMQDGPANHDVGFDGDAFQLEGGDWDWCFTPAEESIMGAWLIG